MDDLHGVLDDPHSHQLLSVVPSVHHERVREPLNDWALSLPEPLHRVSSSSVGDKGRVLSRLNTNVVNKTNVCDLPIHKKKKHKINKTNTKNIAIVANLNFRDLIFKNKPNNTESV